MCTNLDCNLKSASIGCIEIALVVELAVRARAGAIRKREGARAGTARPTAAAMRFKCEVSANAATRQMRGSAGPEKTMAGLTEDWGISKSSASSIGVMSQCRRWMTLKI